MTMNRQYKFQGEILRDIFGIGYIEFPFDVRSEFGSKKAVRIKVWFEGYSERKSLMPMGEGKHRITLSGLVRETIGKSFGDTISVLVEADNEPRTVDVPEYLQWLLDNEPEMKKVFDRMPWSEKKFFVDYIIQASSEDTRVDRINMLFDRLARKSNRGKPEDPYKPDRF
jgi:hypothetical protein